MDGLALVEQARDAGLKLWLVDGSLKMKGPKRLASLVRLISQNKASVIGALAAQPQSPTTAFHCSNKNTCDSAKTPDIPGNPEVPSHGEPTETHVSKQPSPVHRLIGNGFASRVSKPPPEAIHAAPVEMCPHCNRGRVLPELRQMTGGACWSCWMEKQGLKIITSQANIAARKNTA